MRNQENHQQDYSKKVTDHSDQCFSFGKRRQWFSHQDSSSEQTEWKRKQTTFFNQPHNKILISKKEETFRYGNYHQYYGYRNQGQIDPRILCMKHEWFNGKDVLDIGCNAGHFTLDIARDFSPNAIIGIDIDNELVKMAMRNVRHYIKEDVNSQTDFPLSFALSYGPVAQSIDPRGKYPAGNFPFNVQFVQGNYILSTDSLVDEQEEFFDTVLCLSITKWIHLNWGDEGIKRLFRRIYNHLRPGGHLILEAQAYQNYARKKKITEEVYHHFTKIKLYPEMFNEYLLKEVGFESCELIDTPAHSSQGFSRPIYLFKKTENTKSSQKKNKHVMYYYSSDSHCEDSDVELLSD